MTKQRLDVELTARGLAESRQKAQAMIMAGQVYVDGRKVDKAGTQVGPGCAIEVRGRTLAYVSRGGLKLEKAVERWPIRLEGAVCADIGSSTGGFTQLDWRLRSDPRVVCMERTNARYLTGEQIPEPLDFFSVDVAFISLRLILPPMRPLVREGAQAVCLVKPQFEAGREKVGKKGVVRDPAVHLEVLEHFLDHAREAGFSVKDITFSPITGPEGNIEYLGWLGTEGEGPVWSGDLRELVEESHRSLQGKEGQP